MSDVVNKKTVDEILEEINQIDITEIELDEKALEFLKTLEAYLHCFDEMEALYKRVDPDHKLADYELSNPNLPLQQVSNTGETVESLAELYEAAEIMSPVFNAKINGLLEQVTTTSGSLEESSGVEFKLAPLKGMVRASEKAQDDYSKKKPGPAVSWLYDIVRGSILFDKAEVLFQFLELLRADESIVIVKFKNRFRNPTLSGYRDFNMQLQITNEEDGSKHICELQLHIRAIKEADTRLKSHDHYEFFRKYYAGATDSLEERMNDLRVICKGGSLDMAFLTNVIENSLEVDQMTRLADLFKDYMNEYQLAIVITNALKERMELDDWHMRMGGLFCFQTNKKEAALALYEQALDIRLKTLGPYHADVAQCYENMACVLHDGKLGKAMVLHQKALDIRVKALGQEHEDVAKSYNNMAHVQHFLVRLEEAMELYKKALNIQVKALGPNHIHVAMSYYHMANVLQKQGKLEEAMTLLQKVLDMQMKALGPYHKDVANSYNSMGAVLSCQGKLEEAMTMYQKSLDIYLKVHGPEHTLVAFSYGNMAIALNKNEDKLEEALELYQKARNIYLKVYGPDHKNVNLCDYWILDIQNRLKPADNCCSIQ